MPPNIKSLFFTSKKLNSLCKLCVQFSDNAGKQKDFDLKNLADFKKSLRLSGRFQRDGFTCLETQCRLCEVHCSRYSGFLNKKTGIFFCPKCEVKLPLPSVICAYEEGTFISTNLLNQTEFKPISENLCNVSQEICDRLKIKGLKASDLEYLGVKYEDENAALHFPLKNAASKVVGEKTINLSNFLEETFPKQNCSGLLVYGNSKFTKAILVSNILDFLSLVTQKIESFSVVCLPYLLTSLPQESLPGLEHFKELIFWFDADTAAWDSARSISIKLDEKRCLFIRQTDVQPSPYKALKRRLNLNHIIKTALPILHKSITTFSSLKEDILSELQNIEKVNGVKWKRFPILNKLLKGHRRGELTILTGPTGCGKTTFMSEYSLDLVLQGVSTLWGSFEIRNTRLASTLLRQFVGYALDNKLHEFEHWTKEFEKYPLYFMTFHGQQTIKVVMEAIEHAQYVHDINHVIIDNVQFMMGVSPVSKTDKFWEQDAIIAAFRSFATKQNVHVSLVMHPRKERESEDLTTSSIFGSAKATQEADNVLIIQDRRLTSVKGKKFLQIAKNRYSGDLGVMPLDFNKEALSYAKKRKEKILELTS